MVSTHKGNNIYLHLFAWPEKQLKLSKFEKVKITSVQLLNGAKLSFSEKDHDVLIQLPEKQPDENNTVIVLQLDKKVSIINPLDIPDNTLISK